MIRSVLTAAFCLGFLFVSCQQKESVKNLPPVETEKPNSDNKPAFAGQTRIMGYKTQTPYKVDVINHKLGKPWGISQLPDGNFLITEKSGYINLILKTESLLPRSQDYQKWTVADKVDFWIL